MPIKDATTIAAMTSLQGSSLPSPIVAFVQPPELSAVVAQCAEELGLKIELYRDSLEQTAPEDYLDINLAVLCELHPLAQSQDFPHILRSRTIILLRLDGHMSADPEYFQERGYHHTCETQDLKETMRDLFRS